MRKTKGARAQKRRYNGVHDAYSLVMEELGDLADAVSRQYMRHEVFSALMCVLLL